MSMATYRYTRGGADKFWRIEYWLFHTVVEFGRVGTKGQRVEKTYKKSTDARVAAKQLIAEKLRKGYLPVRRNEIMIPKSAPRAEQVRTALPLPAGVEARLGQRLIAPHAATIKKLSLPAIRLRPKRRPDARIPVGASKLGGHPDLPPGVDWPTLPVLVPAPSARMARVLADRDDPWSALPPADGRAPLSFVAQIRLTDIAKHDKEKLLPRRGMLYFFHCTTVFESDGKRTKRDWDPIPGSGTSNGVRHSTYEPGAGACRVFHFDGDLAKLARTEPPEAGGKLVNVTASFAIGFAPELTLPQVETAYVGYSSDEGMPLRLDSEAWDAYRALNQRLVRTGAPQLLGHPAQAQPYALEGRFGEVQRELFPALKKTPPETARFHLESRLLLQLGYSVDHGTPIYFGIRLGDLRKKNFTRAWSLTQRG